MYEFVQLHSGFGKSDGVIDRTKHCAIIHIEKFIWKPSTWLHNIQFYIPEKWYYNNNITTTKTTATAVATKAAAM